MGDEADVAKAVVQGTVEGALSPLKGLLERLFGEAADEGGLILGDVIKGVGVSVRARMQLRTARVLLQTNKMLQAMGIEAQQVPLKVLLPILQNAALEEDNDLQDRWAALLANHAIGKYVDTVFPEVLRQLSSPDAHLIRRCFYQLLNEPGNRSLRAIKLGGATYAPWHTAVTVSIEEWKTEVNQVKDQGQSGFQQPLYASPETPMHGLSLSNLERLGLIKIVSDKTIEMASRTEYFVTEFGYTFAMACEDPTLVEEASNKRRLPVARKNSKVYGKSKPF